MIDTFASILQMAVLFLCIIYGIKLILTQENSHKYFLITCALGCVFLADLVYYLYILINGSFPSGFSAADISYIGSYMFFVSCALYLKDKWSEEQKESSKKYYKHATAAVIFTVTINVIMIVEMLIEGYSIVNIVIYLPPTVILAWFAIILYFADDTKNKPYHLTVVLFLFFELMMFLFSSFAVDSLYYIFDFGWTMLFPFVFPMARRGDSR